MRIISTTETADAAPAAKAALMKKIQRAHFQLSQAKSPKTKQALQERIKKMRERFGTM